MIISYISPFHRYPWWVYLIVAIAVAAFLIPKKFEEDREPIGTMYCYYINNGNFDKVKGHATIEKGYQDLVYYYPCPEMKYRISGGSRVITDSIKQVDVIYFTTDSLLANIRVTVTTTHRGGMVYETQVFVPAITLHDSLPPGTLPLD